MYITLRNVKLIKGLDENSPLISVSKLCDDNYKVLFEGAYAIISYRSQSIIKVNRYNSSNKDLYQIDASMLENFKEITRNKHYHDSPQNVALFVSAHKDLDRYVALHDACAHRHGESLKQIYEALYGTSLPKQLPFCNACAAAKVHKTPLPKSARRTPTRINQHIGLDFIVFSRPDRHKNRYLLHVKDKYSQHAWGYATPTRAIMTEWAIKFITYADRQHPDSPVAVVHFDGELATNDFMAFVQKKGIEPNKTAPYNSQQNFIERQNRTAQEAGKAMLQRAGLPSHWLIQACLYAIFIINHLPNKKLSNTTGKSKHMSPSPSEVWHKYRARSLKELLRCIRAFGCAMWALKPSSRADKQALRGEYGILLGRAPYAKCWLMFSLERHKEVEVLHCVMNETFFPAANAAAPRKSLSLQKLLEETQPDIHSDTASDGGEEEKEEAADDKEEWANAPADLEKEKSVQEQPLPNVGINAIETQATAAPPYSQEQRQLADEFLKAQATESYPYETKARSKGSASHNAKAPAQELRRSQRLAAIPERPSPPPLVMEEMKEESDSVTEPNSPRIDELSKVTYETLKVGDRLRSQDDVVVEVQSIEDEDNIVCLEPEAEKQGPWTYTFKDLKPELLTASVAVSDWEKEMKKLEQNSFTMPMRSYRYMSQNPFDGPPVYYEAAHTILPSTSFTLRADIGLNENATSYLAVERAHRAEVPKVGVTLADEISLPEFSFQFASHPLYTQITQANTKEWQDLYNAGTLSEPMDLPQGHTITPTKWVLKAKGDHDGFFTRLKSRLTLRGDLMKKSSEQKDNPFWGFSPVTQITTIFALVALHQHDESVTYWQLDYEQAFLTADMRREVYIRAPRGYANPGEENKVHLVKRALYGGDDSGRCFYDHITTDLKCFGFKGIHHDTCYLHIYDTNSYGETSFIKMSFHVDDFIIAQRGAALWTRFKRWLVKNYRFSLNILKHLLGMLFERDTKTKTTKISQQASVSKLLRMVDGIVERKPKQYPIVQGSTEPTLANLPQTEKEKEASKYFPMMQILGHLNWLQTMCYPEISYPLKVASRFNLEHGPIAHRWVRNILHYLQSDAHPYRIIRYQGHLQLDAYADSNHIKDKTTCRPISGTVIRLGGNLIRHIAKREKHVTQSTPESETYSIALTAKAVMACKYLIEEMGGPVQTAIPIYVDCKAAIHWCTNPVHADSNGHMHAKYFYVRLLHAEKHVVVCKVDTKYNLADLLVTWKDYGNFLRLTISLKESKPIQE